MHPETIYNLVAWAVAAVNSIVAVVVFVGLRRRQKPLPAASSALTAAAVSCLFELLLLSPFAGPFGIIRLVQYNLAVPTAALGLCWMIDALRVGERRRAAFGLVLIVPGLVIAYAAFVGPYRLKVERTEVPVAAEIDPVRIVVLADLQTDRVTAHEHAAIDAALAASPDLILMPGDLFQTSESRWQARNEQFRGLIERLDAPAGVFAVPGNTDELARLRPFLADSPIRLLEDEIVTVEVRGTSIAIAGLALNFMSSAGDRTLRQLSERDADVRIVLAHYPDTIHSSRAFDGLDLVIAGHTHGGQLVIPGFGPPMTLTSVPRDVAAGGLHTLYGQQIYVSRGIGMERGTAPPVRLFCPPEVSVLTLR